MAGRLVAPVHQFREFPVFHRVGAVVVVEADVEVGKVGAMFASHGLDELFRCDAFLLRAQHDRGAVGVVGADIDAVMAL